MDATTAQQKTTQQPRLMDRVRESMRVTHYALSTERSYCHWIKRFIIHHGKRHPSEMGAAEVEQFLTHLATRENVSAGTQNQAMHSILYLYRQVLGIELPWLDGITRARESKRIPTVLTQRETQALLRHVSGTAGTKRCDCASKTSTSSDARSPSEKARARKTESPCCHPASSKSSRTICAPGASCTTKTWPPATPTSNCQTP